MMLIMPVMMTIRRQKSNLDSINGFLNQMAVAYAAAFLLPSVQ